MPNYQEQQIVGTRWRRCHRVEINNPYALATKGIIFHEAEHTLLGDGTTIEKGAGFIHEPFDDPAKTFPLRNPETDEVIPGMTMTYMDVYVALYSLYRALADRRDNPPAS